MASWFEEVFGSDVDHERFTQLKKISEKDIIKYIVVDLLNLNLTVNDLMKLRNHGYPTPTLGIANMLKKKSVSPSMFMRVICDFSRLFPPNIHLFTQTKIIQKCKRR